MILSRGVKAHITPINPCLNGMLLRPTFAAPDALRIDRLLNLGELFKLHRPPASPRRREKCLISVATGKRNCFIVCSVAGIPFPRLTNAHRKAENGVSVALRFVAV